MGPELSQALPPQTYNILNGVEERGLPKYAS